MNEVTVNEQQLEAEADAALESAPAGGGGPSVPASLAAESWGPFVSDLTPMVRIGVLPQWQITDEESKAFADSLGKCLDQLFPGGPSGKYACWVQLIATCGGIVLGRYLAHGQLPPMGPKRVEETKPAPRAPS